MPIKKIAVLGAGNGGCAAAADLTLNGYQTHLYSRSKTTLQPMLDRGGIELIENGKHDFVRPYLITFDLAEAIADSQLIMITAPAVATDFFAKNLASKMLNGQTILINGGHTGGGLHLAFLLKKYGYQDDVEICETVTLSYICRLLAPTRVEIYRRTTNLYCASFPGKLAPDIFNPIKEIYPNMVQAENVMQTGLSNINAIMHPAGMIGNAGWIENSAGNFYFYRQGITPAIAELIKAVDDERLNIVEALGLPSLSFIEIFFRAGLTTKAGRASGSIFEAIQESAANHSIKAPVTLEHRYLKEDVGYGLVPMAGIARLVGVKTPIIDSLITIASRINQIDYNSEGLTIEKMGLMGITKETLKTLLFEGL